MPRPVFPRSTLAPRRPCLGTGALTWAFAWALLLSALASPALGAPSVPEPSPEPVETALAGEFHRATAPHLALARQTVRRGQWPLWNDRAGAGYPLLGTAASQLLHPFSLLTYPLPAAAWLPWLAFLRILTGLGLAFALQRRLGSPAALALAGAVAYACGVAALAAHPLGTHAALAPGLLLAVDHLGRGNRARPGLRHAALTFAFVLVFAAGDPPGMGLACLAAIAFLAAVVAARPPEVRRRRLAELVACGGLAALVTAPVLATTFPWHGTTYPVRRFALQRSRGLTTDPLELEWGLGMTSQPIRLDVLRGPETHWVVVLGLALVALAVAAWWQGRRPAAGRTGKGAHPAFFAGLGAVAWLEVARPPVVSSLFEYYHLPPAAELTAAAGLPWLLLALATLATAVTARAVARPARLPGGALAGTGVLAAIFLTLVPVLRQPAPPPRTEVVQFLQERQRSHGYSRVAALGPVLPPETLARHGLSDARGYLDHLPADYVEVAPWIFALPDVEERAEPQRARTPAAILAASHSPLYRFLGVRWTVTEAPWPADQPPPGRLAGETGDLAVFERADALPILFLPRQVRTRRAPDGWLPWVRRNRDFGVRTLSQEPPRPLPLRPPPGSPAPPREGSLQVVTVGSTRLTADVAAERRRLVASSVFQDGGWHALSGPAGARDADLKTVPTVLANGPFVAAWLPPGHHRVTFLYRPPGFLLGLAAAALGLALAVVWLLPAPRRLTAGGGAP